MFLDFVCIVRQDMHKQGLKCFKISGEIYE